MDNRTAVELEESERAEIINLLHGALARHSGSSRKVSRPRLDLAGASVIALPNVPPEPCWASIPSPFRPCFCVLTRANAMSAGVASSSPGGS